MLLASSWLLFLLLLYTVAVLLVQGAAVYLAALMPGLGPDDAGPTGRPRVSAIIAARNEEEDLGPCLDSLLAQDYPNLEVIVVDGGSNDRTVAVARARGDRVRVIPEPPLPPGWVGKNWACSLGATAATGELLLFTDADMRYHSRVLSATLGWAEREGADMVTLAPRVEAVGFWERVVLPFYTQMVLTYFRAPRMNRPGSRAALANGQYWLVRRSVYEAIGGHSAVRGYVLEDIALARLLRDRGATMRIAWAPELLSTRMYRTRDEMFEGILKNIHGTRFSLARQLGITGGLLLFFLAPLAVLPLGLAFGSLTWAAFGTLLLGVLLAKHVGFAAGVRERAVYGLLFPLAVGFYLAVLARSIAGGLAGRPLRWKGREYPLDPSDVG
ncbi:MAG TPA: glycosyltransferase family 2 protein [Thermoplasmata archaeon]|nr:glycosyltransferase family 2 protein [Thermoplasmata archaeon]